MPSPSSPKAAKASTIQRASTAFKKVPYEVYPLLAICVFSVSYGSYMLYATSRYAPDVSWNRFTNQMPWLKIDNDPSKHPKSSIHIVEGTPVHYHHQPSFFSPSFYKRKWNNVEQAARAE